MVLLRYRIFCPPWHDLCKIELQENYLAALDGISLASVLRGKKQVSDDRGVLIINYSRMLRFFQLPVTSFPDSDAGRSGSGAVEEMADYLRTGNCTVFATDPIREKNVIDQHPEVVVRKSRKAFV